MHSIPQLQALIAEISIALNAGDRKEPGRIGDEESENRLSEQVFPIDKCTSRAAIARPAFDCKPAPIQLGYPT
jgi:hypothetical protein